MTIYDFDEYASLLYARKDKKENPAMYYLSVLLFDQINDFIGRHEKLPIDSDGQEETIVDLFRFYAVYPYEKLRPEHIKLMIENAFLIISAMEKQELLAFIVRK